MHDLTHRIETGMQTYPGDPTVRLEPVATHDSAGYRESHLACGTHTGTHVDAPAHTEPDGQTLEDFDLDAFVRTARRVDCRDFDAREPIPADRVPTVESDVDCLVFWTGWDTHWGTDRYLDHPYLSATAARRCGEQGLAVGVDTLNPDPTPSERSDTELDGLPAHHALLGAGLLLFENLRNLGAVGERFELRAYPIRVDSDGAPVRTVGVNLSG